MLHIGLTFIRPLHESASHFPVGGFPKIEAPSSIVCRGFPQKQGDLYYVTLALGDKVRRQNNYLASLMKGNKFVDLSDITLAPGDGVGKGKN